MKPKSNPFLRNLLTATAAIGLCSSAATAADKYWNSPVSGSGGSVTWATPGNWTGGAPTNDLTTDIARFNQTSYNFQPNYGTTSVNGLIVGDGTTATAALTLSGTALSIGANGIDIKAASGTVALNNAVRLGASQTWTNNSSSLFTVSATVTNVANLAPYILTIDGTGNTTMSAAITNGGPTGTTGLTKNGSGTLTLSSNSNAFTGGLILSAGTLRFSQVNALGGGNVTIGGSGNTVIDNIGGNFTVSAGVTGWTLTGAGTITRANSGTTGTGGGIGWGTAKITGSSGGLIYTAGSAASGIQVGAVTSDYTGGTTLTSGTIILNGTNNADTSTAGTFGNGSVASNVVTFNGASLRGGTSTATRTIYNNISFAVDTSLDATSSGAAGTLTWAGEVTLNGSGTGRKLTQKSSTQDWVFSNTIKNGTVSDFNVDFASGGSKSVTLSGANTFNGTLLASGTGGGSLALGNLNAVQNATLDTGTSTTSRAVTFTVAGNNTYNIGALQGADNLDIQGNTISVGAKAADTSFTGVISNSAGTGNLTKTGGKKLTLTQTNTFDGLTTVSNGTLELGHATDTLEGAVTVNGAAAILALGGNSDTVGAVTLTSGSITGTGGTLTGTGSNFDVRSGTISAKLGGTVGLDKTTGGTVTISSDNSSFGYTGATTVSAGKLVVNGNISTSTLTTVSGTGTLGGSGTVGALTIANGGTLAPGTSPGTISVIGNLGLSDSSILAFELNPLDTTVGSAINDLVAITGGLTLDGLLRVTATSGNFLSVTNGTKWTLFTYSTSLIANNTLSFDPGYMPSLDTGLEWSIDTATTGQVNLVVVPEPNVAALLGGLGTLLLLRRRRA